MPDLLQSRDREHAAGLQAQNSPNKSVFITGNVGTTAVGSVSDGISIGITGVQAQSSVNSDAPIGVEAVGQTGVFGTTRSGSLTLQGVEANGQLNSFDLDIGTTGALVTREIGFNPKGSPLTNAEIDNNFLSLYYNKLDRLLNPNRILYTDSAGTVRQLPVGAVDEILYSDGGIPYWAPNPGQGSGVPISLEVDGEQQSSQLTNINFTGSGVTVTETSPNQFTINIAGSGVAEIDNQFFPGYILNYISGLQFYVEEADLRPMFPIGKRLVFLYAGNTYYGQITAIDYDTTRVDDTVITFAGEDSFVLPNVSPGVVEFGLTTSAAAWAPIANPPFPGIKQNDIISGEIGATNFWVVCGVGGRLAYSTDECLTWTIVNTGTTENLNCLAYDSANQRFFVGGGNSNRLTSSTGTNWVLDTSDIRATGDGSGDIFSCAYSLNDSALFIFFNRNTQQAATAARSYDFGATFTMANSHNTVTNDFPLVRESPTSAVWYQGVGSAVTQFTNADDISAGTWITNGGVGVISAYDVIEVDGGNYHILGGLSGGIRVHFNNNPRGDDNVTFSQAIRKFAWAEDYRRLVCVGDNATVGYLEWVDEAQGNAWTPVNTGFNPTADVTSVAYSNRSNFYVACNSAGQICRSTNGIN